MAVYIKTVHVVVTLSIVMVCYGLELSDNCRNFSLEVINIADASLGSRNSVLAPFPLWNFLFNVALTASGDSAQQVKSALKLSRDNNENALIKANKNLNKQVMQNHSTDVHLTSRTYMFWDNEFQVNAEFKAILNYAIEIENEVLNFSDSTAAAAMANSFMENSEPKFKDILDHTDFDTSRMIITSLSSFEGLWTMPFDALDTTIEPFYSEKGEVIRDIYMMNQRNKFPFTNIRELGAFVLQMSYGSSDKYCMLILLPSPGKSIREVHQNLIQNFTLKDIFYKLNNDSKSYGLQDIDIKIPRFEIISNRKPYLRGVNNIFHLNIADFSRTTSETIYVSTMKEEVHITVTESGTSATEAIAALFSDRDIPLSAISGTATNRPFKSYPVYPPGFIANKPFIYYVIEKTSTTVVFGGAFSEMIVF